MKTIYSLSVIILLISCYNQTKLKSLNIETSKERVNILSKEVNLYSEIIDAQFDLFNVNGFSKSRTLVPGASSYNYQYAIKIDTNNIKYWTEGLFLNSVEFDTDWTNQFINNGDENWKTTGHPMYYRRESRNSIMIVYPENGIILKKVISD